MAEQTKTRQSVPVILQNLPPAETLNQVVDNLNYLCRVFDDAFKVIETKVQNERSHIISIQERVQKASEQTELIAKYPNKSTTVHSHCEFPEKLENINKNPNSINLDDDPLINMIDPMSTINRSKYNLSLPKRLQKPQSIDTLQLYSKIAKITKPNSDEKMEGLGKLPTWIESIGDTLLFNTDQNPYMKYNTTDNLFGKDQKDRDHEEKELFAAPKTITDRKYLNMDETYDIEYQPELENVPIFNAPTQLTSLASLGNLALDLKWGSNNNKNLNHRIAPSAMKFNDLPELETLPDFGDDEFVWQDDDTTPGGNGTNNNTNTMAPPPPKPKTPPPRPPSNNNLPQPPQPPQQPQQQQQQPPPPPPKPAPQPNTSPQKPTAAAPIAKKSGGGRANLLASIRAGRNLKKSNKAKNNTNSKKKGKKLPPKPLSMMDHLKMKLAARNKIMRGKTTAVKEDKNEFAPPKLDDDDDDDDNNNNNNNNNKKKKNFNKFKSTPNLNLHKPNAKKIDTKTDKTGLGLDKLPDHMRKSMIIMDESDNDELSSGSWE